MIKFNSAANSSNKNKVSLKLNYYDSNRHGSLKRYPTKKKIKLDGTYAIRDNRTEKLSKKSKIFRDPLLKIDPLLKKKEEKKRKILGAPVIPTNLAQTIDLLPSHSVKKKKGRNGRKSCTTDLERERDVHREMVSPWPIPVNRWSGIVGSRGVPKRNGRATVARRNFRLRQPIADNNRSLR